MPISPHTPPGTYVVCRKNEDGPLPDLEIGGVYVVEEIFEDTGWFGVFLVEMAAEHNRLWRGRYHFGYDVDSFDLAVLPREITDLLTVVEATADAGAR
jgi:hypothetical protein